LIERLVGQHQKDETRVRLSQPGHIETYPGGLGKNLSSKSARQVRRCQQAFQLFTGAFVRLTIKQKYLRMLHGE